MSAPPRGTAAWESWRAKLAASQFGRPKGPDAIAKTAAANRGRPKSVITRSKIAAALAGRPGLSHKPAARAAISTAQRLRWKSKRNEEARNTYENKAWTKAVKTRDNYTRQRCGDKPVDRRRVHAHHVKTFETHLELRYVVENGLTLCDKCHPREDKRGPLSPEHKAKIAAGVRAARSQH